MTREEHVVRRYFDAFNRHDLEGLMACFHAKPVIVDSSGARHEGREAVQRLYQEGFALFPDGRCDLRKATGRGGNAMAESFFHGTRKGGARVEAIGPELMEIVGGLIKEIRDYHRRIQPRKAA